MVASPAPTARPPSMSEASPLLAGGASGDSKVRQLRTSLDPRLVPLTSIASLIRIVDVPSYELFTPYKHLVDPETRLSHIRTTTSFDQIFGKVVERGMPACVLYVLELKPGMKISSLDLLDTIGRKNIRYLPLGVLTEVLKGKLPGSTTMFREDGKTNVGWSLGQDFTDPMKPRPLLVDIKVSGNPKKWTLDTQPVGCCETLYTGERRLMVILK